MVETVTRNGTVTDTDPIGIVHYNVIVTASNTNPETKHTRYKIFL